MRDRVGLLKLNRIEIIWLDIVHDGTQSILWGLTGFDSRHSYRAFIHTAPSLSLLLSQIHFSINLKIALRSLFAKLARLFFYIYIKKKLNIFFLFTKIPNIVS